MIIEIYQILLLTAILATAVIIFAGARGSLGGVEIDARTGMMISVTALVLWGLVAINSFEVVVHSGGQEFVESYEQVAWIAVAGGAVALYSLLQATLEEINNTGGI